MYYNILLNPFRMRFPTTCRTRPSVLWHGKRAGKKFAVPGGNEAVTNEISRRETGTVLRKGRSAKWNIIKIQG